MTIENEVVPGQQIGAAAPLHVHTNLPQDRILDVPSSLPSGPETISDMEPNTRNDIMQYEHSTKKERPGAELIDTSTTPPIPANQNDELIQHESDGAAIKAKLHEMGGIGTISRHSPIVVAGASEHDTHDGTAIDQPVRVTNNTDQYSDYNGITNETILTANTTIISGSFGHSDADILIPEATLVLDNDPSIPSASIVEPERNALTIMGKKVNPLCLVLGIILVIVIVISLAVTLTQRRMQLPENDMAPSLAPSSSFSPTLTPSVEPSSSPTSVVYSELLNIITEKTGLDESLFSDSQSTRRMALDWLADDVKANQQKRMNTGSVYSDIEIFERFAMVLLYFETEGDEWFDSFAFLTPEHVCKWRGKRALQKKGVIKCTVDNRVTELALFDNNLRGLLPSEVGLLTELTALNVGFNDISSPFPPVDKLTNLIEMIINNNDFDGLLPDLSSLTRLQMIDFSNNEFEGTLFDTENLLELKYYKIAGNKLTGSVPASLQYLDLDTLHLQSNRLSGDIDFLCENIPPDVDLDCFDDEPELRCNCCIGCSFVSLECNPDNEAVTFINITKATEDFTWKVYDYANWTETLLFAGGGYSDGDAIDISLCLVFPGDYFLETESNGTDEIGSLSIQEYHVPLNSIWGMGQWAVLSLDSYGLPYNVPTPFPTTSPESIVPSDSPHPTSTSTLAGTPTVGMNRTFAPTLAGIMTTFPTTESTETIQSKSCLNINIKLATDAFGEETTYYIYNKDNEPVASQTSFESNTTYDLYECLDPTECYYFIIVDDFDDGICCDSGEGNYTVSLNGRVIGQGGEFASTEVVHIGGSCGPEVEEGTCPDGYSLLNVTVKTDMIGYYDNFWTLWSKSNNQAVAANKYQLGSVVSSQLSCVIEEDCFEFWIRDLSGDGWSGDEEAFYIVKFEDEVVGESRGDFGFEDSISFGSQCVVK